MDIEDQEKKYQGLNWIYIVWQRKNHFNRAFIIGKETRISLITIRMKIHLFFYSTTDKI